MVLGVAQWQRDPLHTVEEAPDSYLVPHKIKSLGVSILREERDGESFCLNHILYSLSCLREERNKIKDNYEWIYEVVL